MCSRNRATERGDGCAIHDVRGTFLLQAAFQEVCGSGFQHADLDRILAATGVTKGALYYHFESKAARGCAIIDEVIAGLARDRSKRV